VAGLLSTEIAPYSNFMPLPPIGYAIGDVVQLKSGGPKMTVLRIELNHNGPEEEPTDYNVHCVWYGEGQHYHEATFLHYVLTVPE
jgi:uncharacterized protein YodC (DUF2158 family)